MSNVRITYADLVTIANSGHDRFVPGLTPDETRELVTDIREHFAEPPLSQQERMLAKSWVAQMTLRDSLAAANAKLERVRALRDDWRDKSGWGMLTGAARSDYRASADALDRALAGQPEAPEQTRAYHRDTSQPEAPKGQMWHETAKEIAERATADFSAAKRQADAARGCPQHGEFISICQVCPAYRDLAAAKAKIAELEQQAAYAGQGWAMWEEANARADAAEAATNNAAAIQYEADIKRLREDLEAEREGLWSALDKTNQYMEGLEARILRLETTRAPERPTRAVGDYLPDPEKRRMFERWLDKHTLDDTGTNDPPEDPLSAIRAILSEMLPPSGIPSPAQRLLLRIRDVVGMGAP